MTKKLVVLLLTFFLAPKLILASGFSLKLLAILIPKVNSILNGGTVFYNLLLREKPLPMLPLILLNITIDNDSSQTTADNSGQWRGLGLIFFTKKGFG